MPKNIAANDIVPFVLGAVMRYSTNSKVDRINYAAAKQQWLAVTTPVAMMPYVDDMVAKMDRPSKIKDVNGSIVRGTGITRYVYNPKWRSSQDMVTLMVKAGIPADASGYDYSYDSEDSSAGKYDGRVLYDSASNLIYWKDSPNKSSDLLKYLTWLDRPVPQVIVTFRLYEVRDSDLRDIGIDYAAWKNGPGLNLFQTAWDAFGISSGGTAALQAATGPIGGFFFAPQFDASFLRFLQQSGKAEVRNSADLTVSNSDSRTYQLLFNPQFQNITKSDNDRTSVGPSAISSLPEGMSQLCLSVIQPIVCLHASGGEVDFEIPPYKPGMNAGAPGVLFFGYDLQAGNVVERNTYGNELIETSQFTGNMTLELNREKILASWDKTEKVEQTIGVPFLCEIPILKYLFSTTTTETVRTRVYLTVRAELLNTGIPSAGIGKLRKLK